MSKVWEVSASDLPALFRAVEDKRPEAVKRGIASAILLSAEIVARAAPKDTKELARSVRGVLEPGGGYVVADAPHAGIVEMGARPHWAPLRPLIEWAKRHASAFGGGEQGRDAQGRFTSATLGDSEAYRVAKAIQRKIAREGQKPTYFMRKTLPYQRRILKAEVEREMQAEDKR